MNSFDLIKEPWIPCIMADGHPQEVSLLETLIEAHRIRDVMDASPLVTAAVKRLLLTLVFRIFGPVPLSQWKKLWTKGRWDPGPVKKYFARWAGRFDLFHPRYPFYQRGGWQAKKTIPIKRLAWEYAAGNNATLFDHSRDDERPAVEPARVARWVIATQMFAASGGKSETLHTKDSPWSRGAVILMLGDNLFETLAINVLSLLRSDFPTTDADRPTWETEGDWVPAHEETPAGLFDYLTWQSRSIRVLPNEDGFVRSCYFAQGRALPNDWSHDPMLAYRRAAGQRWSAWAFDEGRAVWRDSHALINLSSEIPFRIPQAVYHLATFLHDGVIERRRLFQLQVLGQSLEPGRPTIRFWRNECLPLPAAYLDRRDLLERLRQALALAEELFSVLQKAVRHLAQLYMTPTTADAPALPPHKKDIQNQIAHWNVAFHYWSSLEPVFKRFLFDLPSDRGHDASGPVPYGQKVLALWAEQLRERAETAFHRVTKNLDHSAHGLKAVTVAARAFRARLDETLAPFRTPPEVLASPTTGGPL